MFVKRHCAEFYTCLGSLITPNILPPFFWIISPSPQGNKSFTILRLQYSAKLIHINYWFLANILTVNLSKESKYMLTLGQNNRVLLPANVNITMSNTVLRRFKSIKYLGGIFDERFNWQSINIAFSARVFAIILTCRP